MPCVMDRCMKLSLVSFCKCSLGEAVAWPETNGSAAQRGLGRDRHGSCYRDVRKNEQPERLVQGHGSCQGQSQVQAKARPLAALSACAHIRRLPHLCLSLSLSLCSQTGPVSQVAVTGLIDTSRVLLSSSSQPTE